MHENKEIKKKRPFAKYERQAQKIRAELVANGDTHSVRTADHTESYLLQIIQSDFFKSLKIYHFDEFTPENCTEYLQYRSEMDISQSTLNHERQALQRLLHYINRNLEPKSTLTNFKVERAANEATRAYHPRQVELIIARQTPINSLPTRIALSAGLRAKEFFTLRPIEEQAPDKREVSPNKWLGREDWVRFTVKGKGGLCREVRIEPLLAQELLIHKRETHHYSHDRQVLYKNYLDEVNGGNRLSSSFTTASKAALGWSNGFHGLRHTYAQERMIDLQVNYGIEWTEALRVVSQELGHFRPDITLVYLR
jgi:integrase